MVKKVAKKLQVGSDEDGDYQADDQKKTKSVKAPKKSGPIVRDENSYKPVSARRAAAAKVNYDEDTEDVEQVGGFLSPMLASNYDGSQIITNWLMSEKLDGVRCVFDGKYLYSRNGNKFAPPEFFTKDFPKGVILDGELFTSRKNFQECVSIVKKSEPHDGWSKVKYLIFDGPGLIGDFASRLEQLQVIFSSVSSPYIQLHHHEILKDNDYLEKRMNEITAEGGEGIIVRDPNSPYENRRSKTMLKVKRFHDAEATVLKHHKGTGRNSHWMGAIEVKNNDGVTFKIGSGFTDKDRAKPPKIGSVVTYRYFELTKDGVPRFPTFMREHPGL